MKNFLSLGCCVCDRTRRFFSRLYRFKLRAPLIEISSSYNQFPNVVAGPQTFNRHALKFPGVSLPVHRTTLPGNCAHSCVQFKGPVQMDDARIGSPPRFHSDTPSIGECPDRSSLQRDYEMRSAPKGECINSGVTLDPLASRRNPGQGIPKRLVLRKSRRAKLLLCDLLGRFRVWRSTARSGR